MASLKVAIESAVLARLRPHGFEVADSSESNRGSSVRLTNDVATILVTADWLEGEIEVTVGRVGEAAVNLHSLLPLGAGHGLHLSRLSRSVSTSVVASQLGQVADLLLQHQNALLTRT